MGVFYGKQPTISVCRRLLFYIISSSVQLSWAGARKLIFSVKVGLLSVRFKMKPSRWGFKASQPKGKHTFSAALAQGLLMMGRCGSLTTTQVAPGSLARLCLLTSSTHKQTVSGWPHQIMLEPKAVWPVWRQVGGKLGRWAVNPCLNPAWGS